MALDPYIIQNMPDDDEAPLVADLEMVSQDVKLVVVDDGGSYVLLAGPVDQAEGSVVAAFDPTMDLQVVLSLIAVIRQATITGGSKEANDLASQMLAEDDTKDVADVD